MSLPDAATLYRVIDATWPAAITKLQGPWTLRFDQSGSSRVSAATAQGPVSEEEISRAEAAMQAAGQTALFMIRAGDQALDAALAARGYVIKDPVILYAGPLAPLCQTPPPPVTAFTVWPPLAAQAEVWAAGGIGPGRLAIMERAADPKTSFLGRQKDRPAGTAFVAIAEDCAMIHALEVAQSARRAGLARHLTAAAAIWAAGQAARYLTLVTQRDNGPANALYTSLGLHPVGEYHYRIKPKDQP